MLGASCFMFRFLLCCCFPVFAALPVIHVAQGKDISDSNLGTDEILGTFEIRGDSAKTPFILQITFENCRELKNQYGYALLITGFKLKYKDLQSSYKNIDLNISEKGQNCFANTQFYQDIQEEYDMELLASWNSQKASAGIFFGKASFKILPYP